LIKNRALQIGRENFLIHELTALASCFF